MTEGDLMQARRGDRLVIEGHRVGTPPRQGQVLAVDGAMLRVAWDDGHESAFIPGPDCRIIGTSRAEVPEGPDVERFGGTVDLRVVEDSHHCEVVATLMTQRGTFQGQGRSRRHPNDPNMPLIGEELAISRALRALSDSLRREAVSADGSDLAASHLLT